MGIPNKHEKYVLQSAGLAISTEYSIGSTSGQGSTAELNRTIAIGSTNSEIIFFVRLFIVLQIKVCKIFRRISGKLVSVAPFVIVREPKFYRIAGSVFGVW